MVPELVGGSTIASGVSGRHSQCSYGPRENAIIIFGMKISEMGEFGLVEMIAEVLGARQTNDDRVLLDIGDDTAAWSTGTGVELATTDTMVEDVHFRLETTSYRDLGWKALAINLSDIAAMGGEPRYALVSLGLSPDTEAGAVADLYRGMKEIGEEFGCRVVGGDTVGAPCMMINVTLVGEALGYGCYLRRDAAKAGDLIAVTGCLGSSGGGFRVLNDDIDVPIDVRNRLEEAHNRPMPRVNEGQAFLKAGVRAAMDLSDGLMSDLPKICGMSGVSARVSVGDLPISADVKEAFGAESVGLALTAGEDYELLVAGSRESLERASSEMSTPVTVIGEMVERESGAVSLVDKKGMPMVAPKSGWEHFSSR